jgi:hypothetical protein
MFVEAEPQEWAATARELYKLTDWLKSIAESKY